MSCLNGCLGQECFKSLGHSCWRPTLRRIGGGPTLQAPLVQQLSCHAQGPRYEVICNCADLRRFSTCSSSWYFANLACSSTRAAFARRKLAPQIWSKGHTCFFRSLYRLCRAVEHSASSLVLCFASALDLLGAFCEGVRVPELPCANGKLDNGPCGKLGTKYDSYAAKANMRCMTAS